MSSTIFSLTAVTGTSDSVTLALVGAVREDALPEIRSSITYGEQLKARVVLDLSEVTLIDRVAARFFAKQLERGIELMDCPSYLRDWILREVRHEESR